MVSAKQTEEEPGITADEGWQGGLSSLNDMCGERWFPNNKLCWLLLLQEDLSNVASLLKSYLGVEQAKDH